jgi:hypothetical protein
MGRLTSRTALSALLVAAALLVTLDAYRSRHRDEPLDAAYRPQEPVRASYFYNYMPVDHLDSLAASGFNQALVRWITDSLDVPRATELRRWMQRGAALGISIVPTWSLQATSRLTRLPTARRYTRSSSAEEPAVGCPVDSLFWQSVLFDRSEETLAIAPAARRLAVDLEIYTSPRLHHYDAGPCHCAPCLDEFGVVARARRRAAEPAGLEAWQERRIAALLAPMFARVAAAHPGVEVAIFDLDLDSFVHRAVARALVAGGVPTADYCEKSYGVGAAALPGVRARLAVLGHARTPVIGGLWLKRFPPDGLGAAARAVMARADGYFIFTSYSLWLAPDRLTGPYVVPGARADYWRALAAANGAS